MLITRGSEERIDHRSYAEQGIEKTPTVHKGVAVTNIERSGRFAYKGKNFYEAVPMAEFFSTPSEVTAMLRAVDFEIDKIERQASNTRPANLKGYINGQSDKLIDLSYSKGANKFGFHPSATNTFLRQFRTLFHPDNSAVNSASVNFMAFMKHKARTQFELFKRDKFEQMTAVDRLRHREERKHTDRWLLESDRLLSDSLTKVTKSLGAAYDFQDEIRNAQESRMATLVSLKADMLDIDQSRFDDTLSSQSKSVRIQDREKERVLDRDDTDIGW